MCREITSRLERGERLVFDTNPARGVLERVFPTYRVDVVPGCLQPRLLSLEHDTLCAGREDSRRMYQSLRWH